MFNHGYMQKLDRDVLGEGMLSEEPYTLVEDMSEMGSRFGGTESERRAVDYLLGKMGEYGFTNVHREEFTYTGWRRGTAFLSVAGAAERQFNVISLPHCGTFSVEGELHYMGLGTPAEWEAQGDALEGKIVIVDAKSPHWIRRGIHRLEKYGRAIHAGAAGFIWMRDQGGFLVETGGLRPGAEIPGIAISREEGMELIRLARKAEGEKLRVRIDTENTVEEMSSWNVVGEIQGDGLEDRVIIVGAHFDGHDICPGSMDDASGAAVAMEAGRLLARHRGQLARTVRIICFPVEEIGLLGSRSYVKAHRDELDDIDFMLNLDGAGRSGEKAVMLQSWPELLPVFGEISADMKWPFVTDTVFGMSSDMYPFSYAGVPSGRLADVSGVRTGRDWGHTVADTLDKVSSLDLRSDSTFVARVTARLANWDGWPATRKSTGEILRIIEREGLGEVLHYSAKRLS
ncbi:MAG: M28 family peptidase [Bacillota bacterium]